LKTSSKLTIKTTPSSSLNFMHTLSYAYGYFEIGDILLILNKLHLIRKNNITSGWYHRDILIEAISKQKVWATKVSSGSQGGEPTLHH